MKKVEGRDVVELQIWTGQVDLQLLRRLAAALGTDDIRVVGDDRGRIRVEAFYGSGPSEVDPDAETLPARPVPVLEEPDDGFVADLYNGQSIVGRFSRAQLGPALADIDGAFSLFEISRGCQNVQLVVLSRKNDAS